MAELTSAEFFVPKTVNAFKRTPAQLKKLRDADPAYNPNANFKTSFGGGESDWSGATGQVRTGGNGGTGLAPNTTLQQLTPDAGKYVMRVGGNGGTGLPANRGMPSLEKAVNPYADQAVMMAGGRGPGSAIGKLPGYMEDYAAEADKTGGVRPGAIPPMNAVEDARARNRVMATPSGAPGIGGTGGSAGLDPRRAALNAYPSPGYSSAPSPGYSSAPSPGYSSAPGQGYSSAPGQGGTGDNLGYSNQPGAPTIGGSFGSSRPESGNGINGPYVQGSNENNESRRRAELGR